jgi:DNA-binding transcriptional regulator YiaG
MKREQFTKQFKRAFDESGLSARNVAGLFSTTPGTIGKWADGRSAPATLARKNILDRLNKKKQT